MCAAPFGGVAAYRLTLQCAAQHRNFKARTRGTAVDPDQPAAAPVVGHGSNGSTISLPAPTPKVNAMTSPSLTPADRARLKSDLEARRAALRVDVKAQMDGSDDDRVVGLRNRFHESGDEWGVADGLAELDIAEVRHALAELNQVDAALARLRDGTYGHCADCGEPIAPARLFAYPTAMRCLACQAAWEKKAGGPPVTAV